MTTTTNMTERLEMIRKREIEQDNMCLVWFGVFGFMAYQPL